MLIQLIKTVTNVKQITIAKEQPVNKGSTSSSEIISVIRKKHQFFNL